ncbi:hypothetical protein AGMMS50262_17110 [Bacteroidia bacterium]|nr:hypothetical protein AGMMS50262_17110 [Bacteroidia bacterium]
MSKSILRQTILLFLLSCIFVSCITEDSFFSKERLSPEAIEAKTWYDNQNRDEGIRLIQENGGKDSPLFPEWRMAFSNENEQYKITEIPLGFSQRKKQKDDKSGNSVETVERFVIACAECGDKYRETGDTRYMAFAIRLIIRINKETNEKDGFVMIAYPDLTYLEEHLDNPLQRITYLQRDDTFSGMIYYHNMEGNFVNGYRYIDGKAYAISRYLPG